MKIFKIKYLGPEKQREVFSIPFVKDIEQKHENAGLAARCIALKCFSVVESFEEIKKPDPTEPAIIMTGKEALDYMDDKKVIPNKKSVKILTSNIASVTVKPVKKTTKKVKK